MWGKLTIAVALGAALGVGVLTASAAGTRLGVLRDTRTGLGTTAGVETNGPAFPLKVSANRRYLVDQRNVPFFIVGDSPQAMIGNLSVKNAAIYVDDRRAAGFNSLLVDILCVKYTGCRASGATFDGIKPFTTPGDLSTPNPAYFARASAMITLAARAGLAVFLDPIETGGWLGVLQSNGVKKDYAYGQFLGRTYGNHTNIVWQNGNDFQSWRTASDDADVLAVARGIRSVDKAQPQSVELNYSSSGSLDDPRWRAVIDLDAAYTYYPTYAQVLKEYDRKNHLPVFMIEAGYEFEQNTPSVSYGSPQVLRMQEYWSILAGASGQFYGNHYTWQFASGWKQDLDTLGSAQVGYLARLFEMEPWYELDPDQAHAVVTSGYGTFATTGSVASSNLVTTGFDPDGTLAISYLPAGGRVSVDLARFAGPVDARWYDPTEGTFSNVSGSPFPNSGSTELGSPGPNSEGDPDWVLVLTARHG